MTISSSSRRFGGFNEDRVYSKTFRNGSTALLCVDGHLGSKCADMILEIFRARCHEMLDLRGHDMIDKWFFKNFAETTRYERTGACVLMGLLDSKFNGWFINLGDCRLFIDGQVKTVDDNVSCMSREARRELEQDIRFVNMCRGRQQEFYGLCSTHMLLIKEQGYTRQEKGLQLTASLGDFDFAPLLRREPTLVYALNCTKVILVTDGVTHYLSNSEIMSCETSDEVLDKVRGKLPQPCEPHDDASAIVVTR